MNIFRTISVFALAFLVLLSSSSFIVGVHFCSGKVANISVLTEADKCAMEKSLPPCHKHATAPCCDDETILHEGEGFKVSSSEITISPVFPADLPQNPVLISLIIPDGIVEEPSYILYDPPLRSYDLVVTHQVFLI